MRGVRVAKPRGDGRHVVLPRTDLADRSTPSTVVQQLPERDVLSAEPSLQGAHMKAQAECNLDERRRGAGLRHQPIDFSFDSMHDIPRFHVQDPPVPKYQINTARRAKHAIWRHGFVLRACHEMASRRSNLSE